MAETFGMTNLSSLIFSKTVTSQVAVSVPTAAVIVAVPAAFAVITPSETAATASLSDVHVTFLSAVVSFGT